MRTPRVRFDGRDFGTLFVGLIVGLVGVSLLTGSHAAIPVEWIGVCCFGAEISASIAVILRRSVIKSLDLTEPLDGNELELVRTESASFTSPLIMLTCLFLGAAVGLSGMLGNPLAPFIGLAEGMLIVASVAVAVTGGMAYCRSALMQEPFSGLPPELTGGSIDIIARERDWAAGLYPSSSTVEQRSGYVQSLVLRLSLAVIAVGVVSGAQTGLVLVLALEAWLACFYLLLRVHRTKLWHVPEQFQYRMIIGTLCFTFVGLTLIQNSAAGDLFLWLVYGTSLALVFSAPGLSRVPRTSAGPSPTMMVVDRLLAGRAVSESPSATLLAIDKVLVNRPADTLTEIPAKANEFGGRSLANSNFSGQSLNFANFQDADLRYCNFDRCHLEGVDFSNANLEGATFRGATIAYAVMAGADVTLADFANCKMFTSDVTGCRFGRSNLAGSFFRGLWFDDTTTWPEGINPEFVRTKRARSTIPPPTPLGAAKARVG